MSMGLFPKNRAAPVLVDLNAWIPFVLQVSSLPDHHFVNGYISGNLSQAMPISQSCGDSGGVRPEMVVFKSRLVSRTSTGIVVPMGSLGITAGETPRSQDTYLGMGP